MKTEPGVWVVEWQETDGKWFPDYVSTSRNKCIVYKRRYCNKYTRIRKYVRAP